VTEEKTFPAFDDHEVAAGMKFLRSNEKYADLVPPPGTLKVDWFLFHGMGRIVNERRTARSKLALLTGTVVREFVPDSSPERRRLGEGYRDGIMAMFRRRKGFFGSRRDLESTEHPKDDGDQLRLI